MVPFTMYLLSIVYFIPRRETNFGPISSVCDFCLFSSYGTQTSHQNVREYLIYLNIHSLYIQIWRIATKFAILFSTQQSGKMIFNTWTFIVDPQWYFCTQKYQRHFPLWTLSVKDDLAAIVVSRINPAFHCDSSCLDVQWVNIKKDKVSM